MDLIECSTAPRVFSRSPEGGHQSSLCAETTLPLNALLFKTFEVARCCSRVAPSVKPCNLDTRRPRRLPVVCTTSVAVIVTSVHRRAHMRARGNLVQPFTLQTLHYTSVQGHMECNPQGQVYMPPPLMQSSWRQPPPTSPRPPSPACGCKAAHQRRLHRCRFPCQLSMQPSLTQVRIARPKPAAKCGPGP